MKNFLNELVLDPNKCLKETLSHRKLLPAICGYALGVIGLYFAIKLNKQSSGSLNGFFFLFLIWFTLNFLFSFISAASTHLFLEITGYKSSASGIFIALGISQWIFALLIPWGLLAFAYRGISFLTPLVFLVAILLQLYVFLAIIKKVYGIHKTSSIFAYWVALILPFITSFCFLIFLIGFIAILVA